MGASCSKAIGHQSSMCCKQSAFDPGPFSVCVKAPGDEFDCSLGQLEPVAGRNLQGHGSWACVEPRMEERTWDQPGVKDPETWLSFWLSYQTGDSTWQHLAWAHMSGSIPGLSLEMGFQQPRWGELAPDFGSA